jgi:hypothetical protein
MATSVVDADELSEVSEAMKRLRQLKPVLRIGALKETQRASEQLV